MAVTLTEYAWPLCLKNIHPLILCSRAETAQERLWLQTHPDKCLNALRGILGAISHQTPQHNTLHIQTPLNRKHLPFSWIITDIAHTNRMFPVCIYMDFIIVICHVLFDIQVFMDSFYLILQGISKSTCCQLVENIVCLMDIHVKQH